MLRKSPVILVVDDSADDRLLLKNAFKKLGVGENVRTAGDGAEAMEYLMGEGKFADREKFPYPTFILTDLKMPREDGFAVLNFLKQNPEWAVIPTVVLSGSADLDDVRTAYMLGASSYHLKPSNQEGLNKFVSVLFDYWLTCEVPAVEASGRRLKTQSAGKLGARFPQQRGTSTHPEKPDPPTG